MGCVTGFINQHLLLESVLYEYNMSDIQQQQTTVRNDVLITFVFHNCFHNRTSQTTITKYVQSKESALLHIRCPIGHAFPCVITFSGGGNVTRFEHFIKLQKSYFPQCFVQWQCV